VKRTKLTIDNSASSEDLDDYQMLVRLNTTDIPNLVLGSTSGADIRFTDSLGTELKYEIEDWNDGSDSAIVWVKVPTITAGSTTDYIYVYYDYDGTATYDQSTADEQAVWDSNYNVVYHLKENGNGTLDEFRDSTSNAKHGQGGGGDIGKTPTQVAAQIGDGQDFDGNDYVDIASDDIGFLGALTIEVWANPATNEVHFAGKHLTNGVRNNPFDFRTNSSGEVTVVRADAGGYRIFEGPAITTGVSKNYTLVIHDNLIETPPTIYIDGVPTVMSDVAGSKMGPVTGSGTNLRIGERIDGGPSMDGAMDEVRISKVGRSADWIEANYLSQKDSSTFISFGSEETIGPVYAEGFLSYEYQVPQ